MNLIEATNYYLEDVDNAPDLSMAQNHPLIEYGYDVPHRWEQDNIDISKTDLFKQNLLSRRVFDGDNEDGYQTEQFENIESEIQQGKLFPIIVEKHSDGSYQVFDGHHRLIIAKELGMKSFPAWVFIKESE